MGGAAQGRATAERQPLAPRSPSSRALASERSRSPWGSSGAGFAAGLRLSDRGALVRLVGSLQTSCGNAAVQRLVAAAPEPTGGHDRVATLQRCGTPCDCSEDERAAHEAEGPETGVQRQGERQPSPLEGEPLQGGHGELLQRAVTESVRPEPTPLRPRPSVCLVHLHGNEVTALQAAQALVPRCDVNLVHLNNTVRHIHVSAGGSVCEADPNRIFSDTAVDALWSKWNPGGPCATPAVKADATGQIAAFRDQQLWPALRRCMGVPGTLEEEAAGGEGICREGAPVAAFHNNDSGPSIDILAYCPGPGGPPGCRGRLGSEARDNRATDSTEVPITENPHVEPGQDKDDFFLVTRRSDFDGLVAQKRNVVLQSAGVRDDGSLSVRFAFGRYANVEAELGGSLKRNVAMGEQAISQMGATCTPARSGSGPGVQRLQRQTPGATDAGVPAQDAGAARGAGTQAEEADGILGWLRHLWDEVTRVLQQVGTMPEPRPHEAPPRGLPATCHIFPDQADLDTAKARIGSTVIGPMSDQEVISWIVGLTPPPATVTNEATRQRDCMLAAIRAASRRRGSGIRLPPRPWSHSDHRSFARQSGIWKRKFDFDNRAHGGRPFDRVTEHARTRCGSLVGSATRWDPDNTSHRRCWLSTLSADERQQEILQASSAPGISRHHWGTDFDLFDPDMDPAAWKAGGAFADEYSWLLRNASTYGFIQSFTPLSAFMTAGYIEERWHWSYYPAAQALLEFARGHQADIEARLLAEWGSGPQFSYVRTQWRQFMFNVNERAWF
jgi:hypothetical protein